MSHQAGTQLEDFISETYRILDNEGLYGSDWVRSCRINLGSYDDYNVIPLSKFKKIVDLLEPIRDNIEYYLDNFNEEEHGSWRDYKYFVIAPLIDDDINEEILKILNND